MEKKAAKRREKEHIKATQKELYIVNIRQSASEMKKNNNNTPKEVQRGNHFSFIESGRSTTVGFNTRHTRFFFFLYAAHNRKARAWKGCFYVISGAIR